MAAPNLELGKTITLKYDPSVPQNMQEAAKMVEEENVNQAALNNATQLGGKQKARKVRKKRTRRRRHIRGGGPYDVPPGKIEVMPLPPGAKTLNTQENNMGVTSLYADAKNDAMNDDKVGQTGGKKMHKRQASIKRRRSKKRRGRSYKRRRATKRKT